MECPNCGEDAPFTAHGAYATEPHGESHYDEWLECRACGAPTDENELARCLPIEEPRPIRRVS